MANNQGQTGTQSAWQNNREMNIQENSSVTNDIFDDNDATEKRDSTWRPTDDDDASSSVAQQSPAQTGSEVSIQNSETGNKTGDPGRTPGKAEGEEDFQKHGNE